MNTKSNGITMKDLAIEIEANIPSTHMINFIEKGVSMGEHQCSTEGARKHLNDFRCVWNDMSLSNNGLLQIDVKIGKASMNLLYQFNFCPFCGVEFEKEIANEEMDKARDKGI